MLCMLFRAPHVLLLISILLMVKLDCRGSETLAKSQVVTNGEPGFPEAPPLFLWFTLCYSRQSNKQALILRLLG